MLDSLVSYKLQFMSSLALNGIVSLENRQK